MKNKLINISLSEELYKLLDDMSKHEDRSKSGIIRQALKLYWVKMYEHESVGINIPLEEIDSYFPKSLREPLKKLMK